MGDERAQVVSGLNVALDVADLAAPVGRRLIVSAGV